MTIPTPAQNGRVGLWIDGNTNIFPDATIVQRYDEAMHKWKTAPPATDGRLLFPVKTTSSAAVYVDLRLMTVTPPAVGGTFTYTCGCR